MIRRMENQMEEHVGKWKIKYMLGLFRHYEVLRDVS